MLPNANRFGDLRRSTLSWCRRTRISASNAARDLNSPIKAHQINLQRSLIGSKYQPIRSRSQRFWVCGRDRPRRQPICWQSIRQTPLQWVIVALVKALNVVAVEALVTDLHPGVQRAHGRKFLDSEPDRLRCGRKAAIG